MRKDKNGLDYFDRRYKNIEGYDVFKKNLDSFERREMLWSYDALKSLERLEGELERRLENQELNKAFQREIVSEQRKGGIGAIERRTIKAPQGGFKLDDVISITYISPKGEFREFAYKPRCAIKEGYNDVYGGGSNYAQEEMADVGIIPVPIYFENSDKSTRENRKVKEVELYFRYPGKITYYDHNSKKTVVNIKKHTEYIIEGNNEVRDRHSYVTNEEEDMPRDADYEYAREKATRLNAVLWGTRGQLMKLSNLYKKEGHTWVAGRLEYLSKSLVPYYPSPAAAERRNGWHIALRSIEGGSREDTFFSPTDAFNELAQMYGINERLRTVSHDTTRQVGDVRHLERYYIVPEDPKEVIRKISALVTEMSDSRE